MGKSRRNRAKARQRSDPIARVIKPPTDPELLAIRDKSILPVLKDLQRPEPKARTAAARAIANIIQDAKCRKLLLREKIVLILLDETLTDASLESRAAGWEILRILTAEEEADFCVHLYRLDVLTAIRHASMQIVNTITSTNPAFSKTTKAEQNFVWSIAEALAAILGGLAEAQDEALLAAAGDKQIHRFLFTLISVHSTTASALNSVLSCMITLSEDNEQFADAVLGDEITECYKQLIALKNSDGYKAVLACGVLHNLFSAAKWNDFSPGKDNACDADLVPTLSQTLEYTQLSENAMDDHVSTCPAERLQLALEILASIGTTLQETLEKGRRGNGKESWEGFDDKDDTMDTDHDERHTDDDVVGEDGEMNQDEMEADMDMVTAVDGHDEELSGIDDFPTLKQLIQKAIPQVVRLSRTSSSMDEASSLIRSYALAALNNISWTVSCIDFARGPSAAVLRTWAPVAQTIWEQTITPILSSDTTDVDLATIVTSLAWAIARTLHSQTFLSGDEHKKFISLYHASKNFNTDHGDPLQSLGVKCIGVLGQIALRVPLELNREIGIFLLTVVKTLPETPAADAVEALNQIFDVYGDENKAWDREVFWRDNFLQHLEDAAPRVKAMVKKIDKRTSTELRTRAEEANLNLSRFIHYKQKHRP
ncbi:hypothetical protein GGS23DRAFT_602248 [Durotheca rogersii]|uniref:uncharacterized protein n=1 Tax=Durotheca rogersii TaxID=419775 RepID=UPI00222039FA|nr:uncharacterized protein GGS23DRAFT_602248 [Durotheca rogersii]KAI5868470.1 hypothetical protein GGS23DRAFT_602248 [Durotheca rogersii]